MEIEKAIEQSKILGKINCPECGEELFSPMDKLSIYLYGKCCIHLEDNGIQEKNLLNIVNTAF